MNQHGIGSTTVVQVAIVVRDIQQAIDRFSTLFNMEKPPVIVTAEHEHARTQYRGEDTPARARLAFFHMGQVDLELIEPFGGPSIWQEFLDEKGEGVQHIAFRIKGTDSVVEFFGQHGMEVAQQGHYTGGMYTYIDSAAHLGVIVELLENFNV
jgi:catechol 2,3-dioxygenase-like lactoylglutathione lyase family enzyme